MMDRTCVSLSTHRYVSTRQWLYALNTCTDTAWMTSRKNLPCCRLPGTLSWIPVGHCFIACLCDRCFAAVFADPPEPADRAGAVIFRHECPCSAELTYGTTAQLVSSEHSTHPLHCRGKRMQRFLHWHPRIHLCTPTVAHRSTWVSLVWLLHM